MSFTIVWDIKARDFLKKLNKADSQRIIKKINSIADDPKHYLEILVEIVCYKLRIGDFRALIDLNESKQIITVVLVGHRKDIYQYIQREHFKTKY